MTQTAHFLNKLVPITQFNRGQASKIFDRLQIEDQLVVLKNNQPTAVILSPEEFARLSEIEEDYAFLLDAANRLEKNGDRPTISMRQVMQEFGISEQDLINTDEVEIE